MPVTGLDHIALPTNDGERLASFYGALGFAVHGLDEWRAGQSPIFSIGFGNQKINVHPENLVPLRGHPAYLRGDTAEPGSGDLCVVWEGGIDALQAMLTRVGVKPIEGPVPRTGGRAGATDDDLRQMLRPEMSSVLTPNTFRSASRSRTVACSSPWSA